MNDRSGRQFQKPLPKAESTSQTQMYDLKCKGPASSWLEIIVDGHAAARIERQLKLWRLDLKFLGNSISHHDPLCPIACVHERENDAMILAQGCNPLATSFDGKTVCTGQGERIPGGKQRDRQIDCEDQRIQVALQDQAECHGGRHETPEEQGHRGIDTAKIGQRQQRRDDQQENQHGVCAERLPHRARQIQPQVQIRGTSTERTNSVNRSSTRCPSTSASAVRITR